MPVPGFTIALAFPFVWKALSTLKARAWIIGGPQVYCDEGIGQYAGGLGYASDVMHPWCARRSAPHLFIGVRGGRVDWAGPYYARCNSVVCLSRKMRGASLSDGPRCTQD
eukprot:COSAG01_NODE_2223_length_8136_cov_10.727917_7_plen_110_part_00